MPKLGQILRRGTLIVALAAGLMLAGCGGSNGSDGGSPAASSGVGGGY